MMQSETEDPLQRFRKLASSEEGDDILFQSDNGAPEGFLSTENEAFSQIEDPESITKPVKVQNHSASSHTPVTDNHPALGITPPRGTPINQATQTQPRSNIARDQSTPQGAQNNPMAASVSPGVPQNKVKRRVKAKNQKSKRNRTGCIFNAILVSAFVLVTILLCSLSLIFFQYYRIASQLPDIRDLRQRASQFETTRILDRNGNTLYEILDPTAGRRTYVPLDKISPYLLAATIATEDKGFYSHPGFDAFAILRAFWQNLRSGETVSGASTITQQLARTLLFTPEERGEQTYARKVREAVLAAEITRRYTKDEILELYLNEIYYGNLAYGVEAASETYFGTAADQLTLSQAAFLAGLPQAPSVYDIYTSPEIVFRRAEDVLILMYQTSQEQGCIYVSNSPQPICLDPVAVTTAAKEMRSFIFKSPDVEIRYPHWVNFVRSLLEAQFDAQTIYRSGFTVYTTLDPGLQNLAENIVREQVNALADKGAKGGAMVAIRPNTGEILAMVGSPDFYNESASGQVNMAINPRQPGSAIKPLTYAAAFEKGMTPATLLWDVPAEFPPSGRSDDPSPPFQPVNYDGRFHGPVTARTALGNSYNIPAVRVLEFVGIYDDPDTPTEDGLIAFAKRMGINTLNRPDYGLSLTLGGGDVTLLELTGAYSIFANSGRRISPVAITKILDHTGQLVYEYQQPPGEQVIRPEHAYLISSILSDNDARSAAFGSNSVLKLPFQAAAKTGTTNDFRDNWTIGYTPDIVTGVWVGNPDYTPMNDTSGLTGAAPIWANFMVGAIEQVTGNNPTAFVRPPGIVDRVICSISGTEPSQWCPSQRNEIFVGDQPPLSKDQDLWQERVIDTWTGLLASSACPDFADEVFVLNVSDPWGRRWINKEEQGQEWARSIGFKKPIPFAPERECQASDPRPTLAIVSPRDSQRVTSNPLDIYVVANATQWFDYVRLEYGLGEEPGEWKTLVELDAPLQQTDLIFSWDLLDIPAGIITLRLYMHSTEDTYAKSEIRLNIQVPTPTPTQTPTPTETPTPTPTGTPTLTPTQTSTLVPTIPPTYTPTPSPTSPPTAAPPPP